MGLAKKCIYLSLGMHFVAILSTATWSVDAQTIPSSVSGISLRQVELVIAQHTPASVMTETAPPVVEETSAVPLLEPAVPKPLVNKSKVATPAVKQTASLEPKVQADKEPSPVVVEPVAVTAPQAQTLLATDSGIESVLIPPQLLSDADSTPYPKMAKRLRQQGVALLKVKVSEQGECLQVALVSSSGFDLLDRAAMDYAKSWLFESAHKNGEKVSAWVEIPVHFSIRG
ncbi:energy transducer TonB [Shewanella putrefaciens]|uniref:energy transducer TonB n=1 Tax=Shewanella putrefaciens TaxID=24 RepID=UPI002859D382|nr:energy transducer TonB [Shewanella putrefaciens]MDR6962437.1 protein TonB [Shewanella putrefaciens]